MVKCTTSGSRQSHIREAYSPGPTHTPCSQPTPHGCPTVLHRHSHTPNSTLLPYPNYPHKHPCFST
ncbi:hypothetical protein RSAG8_07413, partial [Rhizoctonia solani AG-8 WAC10335]